MNDIFKIFKKRAQAGKSTNIKDVIKDLSENEKDEIGKFDRGNKSYLSISKSGRLKSKKASAQSANRKLNDDLFRKSGGVGVGVGVGDGGIVVVDGGKVVGGGVSGVGGGGGGSLTSSANSSFRSSLEDVDVVSSTNTTTSTLTNKYEIDYGNKSSFMLQKKF